MSTSKLVEGGAGPETTQTLKEPWLWFALGVWRFQVREFEFRVQSLGFRAYTYHYWFSVVGSMCLCFWGFGGVRN